MVDIWRIRNPNDSQFTFHKKQAKNFTRARLDYFLVSENSSEYINNVQICRMCSLSDHRPILLQMSFSNTRKGKGFWRMRNELLTDLDFINGCNNVLKSTLTQYSAQLREQQTTHDTSCEEFGSASTIFLISYCMMFY